MNATFRPLEGWPKKGFEPGRSRERSRFDSHWQATLDLLRYELDRLGADAVVVKLALGDRDIRRDGYPKANARPEHPGVVVEWQIGEAWYRRAAEKYDQWQDNVRAIALTLEALRAVERWGAVSGEQYEGFRKCEECGELVLPGEYHHHEKPPAHDPYAEERHVSHMHLTITRNAIWDVGPDYIDGYHLPE